MSAALLRQEPPRQLLAPDHFALQGVGLSDMPATFQNFTDVQIRDLAGNGFNMIEAAVAFLSLLLYQIDYT